MAHEVKLSGIVSLCEDIIHLLNRYEKEIPEEMSENSAEARILLRRACGAMQDIAHLDEECSCSDLGGD